MSTQNATMYVINNSGSDLQGSVIHSSGDGKNALVQSLSVDGLLNGDSKSLPIQFRTNHDDYYEGGPLIVNGESESFKLHRNVHTPGSHVYLVVNEKGIVVVTQDNGWKTKKF